MTRGLTPTEWDVVRDVAADYGIDVGDYDTAAHLAEGCDEPRTESVAACIAVLAGVAAMVAAVIWLISLIA